MDFVTSGCLHVVGESLSIESGKGASHRSTGRREGFGVCLVGEIRGTSKVIGTISKFIVSCIVL